MRSKEKKSKARSSLWVRLVESVDWECDACLEQRAASRARVVVDDVDAGRRRTEGGGGVGGDLLGETEGWMGGECFVGRRIW